MNVSQTKTVMRALAGERVEPLPAWLMRQAGRYLPEYRKTRAKAGSFLDLCYTPDLAAEVTLQPIRRFGFDASILFADILLVPQALGMDLWFVEGEGPRLALKDADTDFTKLRAVEDIHETVSPVYETVRILRRELPDHVTLIGFAGAPWTVVSYMIAGKGTRDQEPARRFALENPDGFAKLMDHVTEATIEYLNAQIDAGAEVVKLFDSWAGSLTGDLFDRYALRPAEKIVAAIKKRHPQVPVIVFPRGAGVRYESFLDGRFEAVAIDSATPLAWADRVAAPGVTLQGNLDPLLMVVGGEALKSGVRAVRDAIPNKPQIFNLGHGITPDANPDHVTELLETLRSPE